MDDHAYLPFPDYSYVHTPDIFYHQPPAPVVHAPVPVLGQIPLLDLNLDHSPDFASYDCPQTAYYQPYPSAHYPNHIQAWSDGPHPHTQTDAQSLMTFPTPSELLVELSREFSIISATVPESVASPSSSTSIFAESPPELTQDNTKPQPNGPARKPRRRESTTEPTTTDPLDLSLPRSDTISSHEKKRHHLECLEQYIMYLHHQLDLIGVPPVPLKRVQTYRGLSSRSIRTLLVHMESSNGRLNLQTVAEEQKFMALRDEVLRKELVQDTAGN